MAEIKVTLTPATKADIRQVAYNAGFRRLNASLVEVGDIQAMLKAYFEAGILALRQKQQVVPPIDMSDVTISGTDDST
jgi:hypothetical protein